MRIEFVKLKFEDMISYKYKPFRYCCDKLLFNPLAVIDYCEESFNRYCNSCEEYMKDCEERNCASCSIQKEYIDSIHNSDNHMPNMFLKQSYEWHDWDDTWQDDFYYKIHYCPHCGEKIEIVIVGEIDVSDKYNELVSKREKLNARRRKTDSIKLENSISKEIKELDNKINYFYGVSKYDECKCR